MFGFSRDCFFLSFFLVTAWHGLFFSVFCFRFVKKSYVKLVFRIPKKLFFVFFVLTKVRAMHNAVAQSRQVGAVKYNQTPPSELQHKNYQKFLSNMQRVNGEHAVLKNEVSGRKVRCRRISGSVDGCRTAGGRSSDGRRRRPCCQRRRKRNHLIEAPPFGRLDQMLRTTV